jgi:diacylglycerol kinase (ATP)
MERSPVERPAADARRVLVSFSPLAGRQTTAHRAQEIVAHLSRSGYLVHPTGDLAELANLAAEWHQAGDLRCVVACGGDGTAAVVRNHTPLEVPLLLVPLGTENLLGNYVEQDVAPESVRETIDEGVTVSLDLGRYLPSSDGAGGYFLSMISAGFDAEVVRRLHQRRRGNITRFSYVQPTLETIRSYEYPQLRLYCGDVAGQAGPILCRWAFGFNLPLYARGWKVAPDADATDGLLDVCTFERGSVGNVARYLWHVIWKSHFRLSDANLARSSSVRIETVDGAEVAFQVDGDYGGTLPVDVDVLPGELRLLVMPSVAQRLGFGTSGTPA